MGINTDNYDKSICFSYASVFFVELRINWKIKWYKRGKI